MRQYIWAMCLLGFPALCMGEPASFEWAQQVADDPVADFSWGEDGKGFLLTYRGVLSPKTKSRHPALKLPIEGDQIEQVQVQKRDQYLILVLQTTDGDGGQGFSCRIKWPQNILQWCQQIPGFNIHVSSGTDSLYIGAIGFMGRLDTENGHYIWRHDGLYEKDHSMNIVCLAGEEQDTVTYHASAQGRGDNVEQITLNRVSGKITGTSFIGKRNICGYQSGPD